MRPGGSAHLSDEAAGDVLRDAPVARRICAFLAALITALAVAWAADLPRLVGLSSLYTEQMIAVVLGAANGLIFLRRPFRRGRARPTVPVADRAIAAASLAAGLWLAIRFPVLTEDAFYYPVEVLAIGLVLVPLTIEALRRATGLSLLLVVAVFILYGLYGDIFDGKLQARTMTAAEMIRYVGLDSTAMLGRPIVIGVTIVTVFILLGRLLLLSGGSDFFTDIAAALMGRSRGGSAKIAVTASAMFGSISGSAVSNVASTGVITIPLMQRGGYSARAAGAIEAVASTGGQLTPPIMGAAAFLMAEFLQMPYQDIVLAAIIPALLFYVALFVHTDLEAARTGVTALEPDQIPAARKVLAGGWFLIVPFAVLIVVLFSLNQPAETAALAACGSLAAIALVFGYGARKLTPAAIVAALRDTGYAVVDIIVITAAAGIIIGILDRSGLSFGLGFVLVQFGENSLFLLLLLTAGVSILLGMGMPTTGVYFLLAALAAPPLIKLGVEPIAAHMYVLYFGMLSMITPPVAIAAYTAANLSGAGPMETAVSAVRFGWPAYVVPFLFVLSPTLLMQGDVLAILLAAATAVLGVAAVTAALAGYALKPLRPPARLLIGAAGLGLLLPPEAFAEAGWINLAGGAVLALGLAFSVLLRRPGSG